MRKINDKGITFIEILVSVTIFAIMVVPIATQLSTSFTIGDKSRKKQYETDFVEQVMEQFKQTDFNSDAGFIASGYTLSDTSTTSHKVYSKDKLAYSRKSGIVSNTVAGSFDDYKVTVDLNADKYKEKTASNPEGYDPSLNPSFTDPNDVNYYNTMNLDERFCAVIKDNSANYDVKAAEDILALKGEKLKYDGLTQTQIENGEVSTRYNQWLNGVDFFKSDRYSKNTLIQVSSTSTGYNVKCYLEYKDSRYSDVSVKYNILDSDFDKKYLNGKGPIVYFMYNQYVYNNKIVPDKILIDTSAYNMGLTSSEMGDESKKDLKRAKVYIIRNNSTDKVYVRVKKTNTLDKNPIGSCIYYLEDANGSMMYLQPDGTTTNTAPNNVDYDECTSSKKNYSKTAKVSFELSDGSSVSADKFKIFTNLFSKVGGTTTKGFNLVNDSINVYDVKDDMDDSSNKRIYNIVVTLIKNGNTVCKLESAKEG